MGTSRYTDEWLAGLIHSELSEVEFSVFKFERKGVQRTGAESFVWDVRQLEESRYNASDLRVFHDDGVWRHSLFDSPVRVQTLNTRPRDTSRQNQFEQMLEAMGVLSEGFVGHSLGHVLPGAFNHRMWRGALYEYEAYVSVDQLWEYVLIDGCLQSPELTAKKITGWINGDPIKFELCILLGRLNVLEPIELTNGIIFERLTDYSEVLGERIQVGAGISAEAYLGRTLLSIPCSTSPGLWNPNSVARFTETGANSGEKLQINSSWALSEGGVAEIIRALSLVGDVPISADVIWSNYGEHAHFGQMWGRERVDESTLPDRHLPVFQLSSEKSNTVLKLLPKLLDLEAEVATAFKYWIKSKTHDVDPVDKFVYLRTALESLFLEGDQGELRYRLSTYGAWYTGRDASRRQRIYDILKRFYDRASRAVHTGVVKDDDNLFAQAQTICRAAIWNRLHSDHKPTWENIVFG